MPTGYCKETGENPFKGKKRGRMSDETRLKLSAACKGRVPWNKGVKGIIKHTEETKSLMASSHTGSRNHMWVGDKVGYNGVHDWVRRKKGKASQYLCSCNAPAKYWANVDNYYRRVVEDYIAMCGKCHAQYDIYKNVNSKRYIKK